MNRLSVRNNQLKLETAGEIQIILEEPVEEYTQMNKAKTRRCQRVTGSVIG